MSIYSQSEVTVTYPRLMRKLNVSDFVYSSGVTMSSFKTYSDDNMFLVNGSALAKNTWVPASAVENGDVWIMASSDVVNAPVQVQWSNNQMTDYTLYAIPCPEFIGIEMVGCGSEAKVLDDIFTEMHQQFKTNLVVTALPSNWEIKYNGSAVSVGDTISVGENLTAQYTGSESGNVTPESFIEYTIGTAGDYQGLAGKIRLKALKAPATTSTRVNGTTYWTTLKGTNIFLDAGIGSASPIWKNSPWKQTIVLEQLPEHGIIASGGSEHIPYEAGNSVYLYSSSSEPYYKYNNSNPTSTEELVSFVYSWDPWIDEYNNLNPGGRANATIRQIGIYVTPYIRYLAKQYYAEENTATGIYIGTFEAVSPNSSSEARTFAATISGSLGDSILGRLGYTLADIFKVERKYQSGGIVTFKIQVKNEELLDYERLVSNGSTAYPATITITADAGHPVTFTGTTTINIVDIQEPAVDGCLITVNGKLLQPTNYTGFVLKVNR